MAKISAARFTNLKAAVKAEMLRRKYSGSVAVYGGTSYDYSVAAATGGRIRKEHRDKLVTPMNAVNATTVPNTTGTTKITESEIKNLETRINTWKARKVTDYSATDCKSGCTGLCYTTCSGACKGCSGSCSGQCKGCSGSCDGSCSGGCDGCSGRCQGECTSQCSRDGCSSCWGMCDDACTGCTGTCKIVQ